MSFLGKLLVGLQLFLSIVFLIFAGAVFSTQKNWKASKEAVDQQKKTVEAEKQQVEQDFAAHRRESTSNSRTNRYELRTPKDKSSC